MKKLIVSIVLFVVLLGFGVANAQVPTQVNQNQVQIAEILKKIDLLNRILNLLRQIEVLKAQVAEIQSRQLVMPIPSPTRFIVMPNIGMVSSTSTIDILPSPTPQPQYNPTIKLEIVGTKVVWQASGEVFNCRLNGESVWQEGSREANGVTEFTLGCVGTVTGTKIQKSI